MKDSNQLQTMNKLTLTAITLPVVVLLGIIGGVVATDDAALAEKTAASTRISQDINEDYFTDSSRLAQAGGLLQPRESDTQDSEDSTDEEVSDNDGETADADSSQCSTVYLEDNLRIDFDNDRMQVLKLQSFLKTFAGYDYVSLTGNFDADTLKAVEAFQSRYAEDVLEPWGYEADEPTGYVYITTKKKINEIYCDEQFLLSKNQQDEIRDYRQKLNNWRSQGASFETPQYLANYYGYSQNGSSDSTQADLENDSTDSNDDVSVEETPTNESATTATSATSSEDDGGFFDWLFGNDDSSTTSTSSVADEGQQDDQKDDVATAKDDELGASSTSTATSGIDQMAAGIYTGVNSIIDFLLSPTVLLIVLVVLILLLIATLIETEEEGSDEAEGEDDDDEAEGAFAWSSGEEDAGEETEEAAVTDAEVVETETQEESKGNEKQDESGRKDSSQTSNNQK